MHAELEILGSNTTTNLEMDDLHKARLDRYGIHWMVNCYDKNPT